MLRKRAEDLHDQLAAANDELARTAEIPPGVRAAVLELVDVLAQTPEPELAELDPYLALAVTRGAMTALRALTDPPTDTDARRAVRVGLEQARQALRDLLEARPHDPTTSPEDVARWLDATLEVPRRDLADLLEVSRRQLGRWVSTTEQAIPTGEDARRLRVLAGLVRHLRHALTGPGVLAWLRQPHPDLDGAAPAGLLDDPAGTARLQVLASRARSQRAA